MELPQYTLYLSLPRILIPKTLMLLFLGGFLYFGVWLNLLILNIIIPSEYHLYIVLGIVSLLIMQALLNYIRFSNYRYLFYSDRFIFEGKKQEIFLYSDISGLEFNMSALDKIFNTGTINILPSHKMQFIRDTNQVYFYLQKLIQYYQSYNPQIQRPYGYQRVSPYYQQQV